MTEALVNASFTAPLGWRSGHLQTIRSHVLPSHFNLEDVALVRRILVSTADGTGDHISVLIHRSRRSRQDLGTPLIALVHGLGGSADSDYVRNTAHGLLALGFNVARVDLRGVGLSRDHSYQLYHAGRTADLRAVLAELANQPEACGVNELPGSARVGMVGFSLGGNMTIKLLGEPLGDIPLVAAATVSSPLDLSAGSPHLERAAFGMYEKFLLRRLRDDTLRPESDGTLRVSEAERAQIKAARSIAAFDEALTAPRNGWQDAIEYYEANSAARYLPAVQRPALMIHAVDDPMIPLGPYMLVDWGELESEGLVRHIFTKAGGHVGFHERGRKYRWFVRVLGRFFADQHGWAT
jgi:predicted alpha/beta-fold hydrolase